MLEIKGQVLHSVRLHLKDPDWLSDLNALLTRTLPMLSLRLNEISGGSGNMCLVSGSLRRILKLLRISDIFDCKVLWMVREGEWNSVGFFVLDLFSGISRSISWQSSSTPPYKPTTPHNFSIRSDEGLTLETSAF